MTYTIGRNIIKESGYRCPSEVENITSQAHQRMAEKLNKQPGSLEPQFLSLKNPFPNRVRNTALALLLAASSGTAINFGNTQPKSIEPAHASGDITWTLDEMRCARAGMASAVIPGGKIFVIGGTGAEGPNCEYNVTYSNATDMRDTNGNWSSKAPAIKNITNGSADYVNGKIYVTGGEGVEGTSTNALKDVQIYDVASNTWTHGPAMPKERQGHKTIAVNNKLYLIGGFDKNGVTLKSVDVLDTTNNSYTTANDMFKVRSGFGAVKNPETNKIYVFQGNSGDGMNPEFGAEVYDPDTNSWTLLPSAAKSRFNFATVYEPNSKTYLNIAGINVDVFEAFKDVERFNPITNSYSPANDINIRRELLFAHVVNGQIIIGGGFTNTAPPIIKSLELGTIAGTETKTPTPTNTPTTKPDITSTPTIIVTATKTPTHPVTPTPTVPSLPIQSDTPKPYRQSLPVIRVQN